LETERNDRNGQVRDFNNFREIADFLWSIADLLRGEYKQADYGKVILPMTSFVGSIACSPIQNRRFFNAIKS